MNRFNSNTLVNACGVGLLLVTVLTGCGAESQQGGDSGSVLTEPVGFASEAVALNSFVVADEKLTIYEQTQQDGTKAWYLNEVAPAAQAGLLTERLAEQHGDLTILEMFYALAPEGETPHEHLIDVHFQEVAAMQREDDSVRRVDFDVNQLIPKSLNSCRSWTMRDHSGIVMETGRSGGPGLTGMCMANDCNFSFDSTLYLVLGFCNETSATLTYRAAVADRDRNNGDWFWMPENTTPAHTQVRAWWFRTTGTRRAYMRGDAPASPFYLYMGAARNSNL